MQTGKETKLFFINVEIICKHGKFITIVYQNPNFSGVYSNFEIFFTFFL